jgi:peptidoglycan/LPS O-acetylase OafA/YrhL
MLTVGSITFLRAPFHAQEASAIAALAAGLLVTVPLAILFERFVDRQAVALSQKWGRRIEVKSRDGRAIAIDLPPA